MSDAPAIHAEVMVNGTGYIYVCFSHIPRIGDHVTFLPGHEDIDGTYKVTDVEWLVTPDDWGYPCDSGQNASHAVIIKMVSEAQNNET